MVVRAEIDVVLGQDVDVVLATRAIIRVPDRVRGSDRQLLTGYENAVRDRVVRAEIDDAIDDLEGIHGPVVPVSCATTVKLCGESARNADMAASAEASVPLPTESWRAPCRAASYIVAVRDSE